jgi:hypothetical protein
MKSRSGYEVQEWQHVSNSRKWHVGLGTADAMSQELDECLPV